MEYIMLIINVSVLLFMILLGLFIKNYLPSYMDEKGKNLATKEDIKEITLKSESVLQDFRKEFLNFSVDKGFKHDFYFKQYSELYTKLYAIVCQSEYVRHFLKIRDEDERELPFEEAPFLEMAPIIRTTQNISYHEDTGHKITQTKEQIATELTQFNKKKLFELIISKSEYSSQKLLKLAIAYRFAHDFYSHNPDSKEYTDIQKTADLEEVRLIREMVLCIVKEYNFFRKELNMEYIQSELNGGMLINIHLD